MDGPALEDAHVQGVGRASAGELVLVEGESRHAAHAREGVDVERGEGGEGVEGEDALGEDEALVEAGEEGDAVGGLLGRRDGHLVDELEGRDLRGVRGSGMGHGEAGARGREGRT